MHQVLLIEASATRRRALRGLLGHKGIEATEYSGYPEAVDALLRMANLPAHWQAVVIGWPDYVDEQAEAAFSLLGQDEFEHLPVLLLAERNDPAAINWMLKRPSSALLLWSDYSECAEALGKLLAPRRGDRPALEQGGHAHLKVLFVDDSPTVRLAFRRLLMKHGYLVETANDVEEGYAKALAEPFDIAIIDYFMPGANGSELVRRLRETAQTRDLLCAVITGTYADRVIDDALSSGAVECLFKSEARELFLTRLASLARTITDRKSIDAERRRLSSILASVGDGVFGVDRSGTIEFVNPTALQLLGYARAEDLIGSSAHERIHGASEDATPTPKRACFLSQAYASGAQIPNWQTVFWTATRQPLPVECTVQPMEIDGRRDGSVVAFRDVSARRQLEAELRWQASHDALTRLHNRAAFEADLAQEVLRLRDSDQASLLLFVDLDRFKYINDTAGHGAGDQLIVEVGQRLRSRVRSQDMLARIGGDEYALIIRNIRREDIESISEGVRQALGAMPFVYAGRSYRVTASIGAAVLDHSIGSPSDAMAMADIACHIAKSSGRNQAHVYCRDSNARSTMTLELGWSARLEQALRQDQFALCFQPMMPTAGFGEEPLPQQDGAPWSRWLRRNPLSRAWYEVLVRLADASGELILPDAFLPTAERFNMMAEIDRWVIHNALRSLREQTGHGNPVGLSINLSAQSVSQPGIARYILDRIVEYDVDPAGLIFEITESRALDNLDGVQALIQELRQHGCRFALDDFGIGFSSFAHLKQLDVDFLKIDGSFIQGLLDDRVDQAVVRAIHSIAHSAGKRTIAEYVDRPELFQALRHCGVDYVQGYYVGRPKPSLRAAAGQLELVASSEEPGRSGVRAAP